MSDQNPKIRFKDHTAERLHQQLQHIGLNLRVARRLQAAVLQRSLGIPDAMPEVPRRLLDAVRANTEIPRLKMIDKVVSPTDGFAKYLFEGNGPGQFEAVRIPLLHRPGDEKYIVCFSSQVGCAMGCVFCATGKMGFTRNLAPWEIVDQVIQVRDDSPYPVRGIVAMGMGEPFLNYDRVMRAAEILSEPCGLAIDGKAITISTVGIVPMIRRFTAERRNFRLIVSLSAATSAKRQQLLPVENTHPLPELMAALRDYHAATGKRVILAWTLLDGINTSSEDARQIAELTAGLPIQMDLIDVNDPSAEFIRPSTEKLNEFRTALSAELSMPVVRRYSGGQDIHGACGMLAARHSLPLTD